MKWQPAADLDRPVYVDPLMKPAIGAVMCTACLGAQKVSKQFARAGVSYRLLAVGEEIP